MSRFIFAHRRAAVGALGFGMIAGITSSLEPALIGSVIDRVRQPDLLKAQLSSVAQTAPQVVTILVEQNRQTMPDDLTGLILLIVGLAIVTVAVFFGQRYYSGVIAYSVNYDIRKVMFDNMLTLDQKFYQRYPTGDLISRMHGDIILIWQLLALGFTRMGSAVMTLVVTFLLLGSVSLPLTIVVFIVLTISTMIQMQVGLIIAPVFEKVQEQAGVVASLVQDAVSGIQTIKTAGKEASVAVKFNEEVMEYRRRWLHFKRRNEPVGMLPNMISELTSAIVVLTGGIMTLNGTLSLGDFTSFLIYLAMISTVLLQIGTVYQRYQQTRGGLTRLTPLLQAAEIRSKAEALPIKMPRGAIEFQHVTIELEDTVLLHDISLKIPAGKVVAIVGPTGCGKTLLVNLLARVLDPTDGCVLIDGVDVRDYDLEHLRQMIAYVPQSTFLFSQPLHQNVRMGKEDINEEELNNALYISRVSNDLPQLPHGLDTLVGERGVMLSGGQKQRVAIARAIIREPSILILDDALSSVDTQTAADILADLRKVLKTRTSFIIAHRVATVKDADSIIVMVDGQIVEQGTHQELIARHGVYTRMVERELKEEMLKHAD
ncbi:MAG: ABC transporter ATP-binding protein [Anaerolineae bacterium]|nr:ABC transporter ATP-binding protein [Anaerolineae bacterium]